MARKLKTYQTSLGFFDLAIAAPSMKAALQAWGADSNLFHQGAARESHDPDVVAATMAKPGVVLKRPVGSDGPFGEHADLPTDLDDTDKPAKATRKSKAGKPKKSSSRPADKGAERKAALAYKREQKRRDREREKEEAAREKERERRQASVDKAQAALDQAAREHAEKAASIQAQMEALERRSQAEDARWDKERRRLEKVLRRARD
ncbi:MULTISPECIES: cell envelope biogenesis protein TolA [unclassified Bradyrhizobium]|uniref:cell envelope biogenesis protein TolA n=1 Tax=unclassified Bradyrhizobium TaxID=2631580 RepID=UPI00339B6AA6